MSKYQSADHVVRCMLSDTAKADIEIYYSFKNDLRLLYPAKYKELFGDMPFRDEIKTTPQVTASNDNGLLGLGVGLLLGGIFLDD